jgi:Rnl2 family RNA ligase
MLHVRYPKIAQSSAQWGSSHPKCNMYVVCEKIHGANFSCVAAPDGRIAFASRGGILGEDDNFFGVRTAGLTEILAINTRKLRDALIDSGTAPLDSTIIIYGELAGGRYPHPDVPSTPGVLPIQQGVWYSPELVFIGFDVCFLRSDAEDGGAHSADSQFLDFEMARAVATSAGFRFTAPLHTGDFASCLGFDVRFSSRLPTLFGLPSLPDDANNAEGVVIRPLREPSSGGRCMLKIKIPEFSEKRYQHEGWRDARNGSDASKQCCDSGEQAETLLRFEMLACVTEQRLDNVVSKVGFVDPRDRVACRRLFDGLVEDVLDTLVDDGGLLSMREGELRIGMQAVGSGARNSLLPPCLASELETAARALVTKHLRARARAAADAL